MRRRTLSKAFLVSLTMAMVVTACAGSNEPDPTTTVGEAPVSTADAATTTTAAPTTTTAETGHSGEGAIETADLTSALLAAASFQDVAMAEAAGYGSTIDALGCFENADSGGMGLHYLNESLMDGAVDITTPEALVYEMDASGAIAGLVAHEYIVPVDAWTATEPPSLFGVDFHQHPVLPLWVLHAWIWKDNPAGIFEDFNPAVRMCPESAPVFGVDLP